MSVWHNSRVVGESHVCLWWGSPYGGRKMHSGGNEIRRVYSKWAVQECSHQHFNCSTSRSTVSACVCEGVPVLLHRRTERVRSSYRWDGAYGLTGCSVGLNDAEVKHCINISHTYTHCSNRLATERIQACITVTRETEHNHVNTHYQLTKDGLPFTLHTHSYMECKGCVVD